MMDIRLIQPDDEPFLWDMGWDATAVDDGMRALGREAAFAMPHVRRYLDGLGTARRHGESSPSPRTGGGSARPGTVSSLPRTRAGASWRVTSRTLHRRRSRGTRQRNWGRVARRPLDRGAGAGVSEVSLSVDRQNPARRLYERKGFRDAGNSDPTDTSVTMMAHL